TLDLPAAGAWACAGISAHARRVHPSRIACHAHAPGRTIDVAGGSYDAGWKHRGDYGDDTSIDQPGTKRALYRVFAARHRPTAATGTTGSTAWQQPVL